MSTAVSDAVCPDFSQHAWRPELCVNCQRPRSEHSAVARATKIVPPAPPAAEVSIISVNESAPTPVPSKRAATLPRKRKPTSTTNSPQKAADDNTASKDVGRSRSDGSDHIKEKSPTSNKSGVQLRSKDNKAGSKGRGKGGQPRGILSSVKRSKSLGDEKGGGSRVAFIDTSPHIIGYDGGVDNLFLDDEDDDDVPNKSSSSSSSSGGGRGGGGEGNFSLTDEEKSFALLSLENTVWNSEAENLLRDNGAQTTAASSSSSSHPRHSSREFEDLSPDSLFSSRQFQNLKDCDATQRRGTFPLLRKRSSSVKLGLDAVFSEELESSRQSGLDLTRGEGDGGGGSRNGDVRGKAGAGVESLTPAYKIVSIVEENGKDSANASLNTSTHSDSVSENSGNSSGGGGGGGRGHASSSDGSSPTHAKVRGRSRPTAIRVSSLEGQSASPRRDDSADNNKGEEMGGGGDELNDSTTADGLHVLALLNDVLSSYGDESSTDEPSQDGKAPPSGGGKTSNFEARMASVAANLDLTKQRAKRPAPRPPSSPPPEPLVVSPKKKITHQPEPVFKMVPMGKAILAVPPSSDHPKPSSGQGQGLPSFDDLPEVEGDRGGEGGKGGAKKGITSFFKNMLRRGGKESSEGFESSNSEVQFAVRSEVGSSSAPTLSTESGSSSVELGRSRKGSDSAKQRPSSSQQHGAKGGSASTGDLPGSAGGGSGGGEGGGEGGGKTSSPPSSRSRVLSSPKQILRRTAAKLSPPTPHKDVSGKSKTVTSGKSEEKDSAASEGQPTPVRRRAKSPKRIAPPAPPPPTGGRGKGDDLTQDLTQELERRLKSSSAVSVSSSTTSSASSPGPPPPPSVAAKPSVPQPPKPTSLSSPALKPSGVDARWEVRKSMTVPPPSPPTNKVSRSPPTSPTPEEGDSQPGSPTDSNSDDSPRFSSERIELPTASTKKGILGKLNMNRKARAPAPPLSVKRARSISDAEKPGKKINHADISGPLPLAGDGSGSPAIEQRRNTISMGDDATAAASSAVAQSIEKGYDDLDMPILSPLGSLENLYEAILPKEGATGPPYYDPPDKAAPRALCPNVPAEGYLEPVGTGNGESSVDPKVIKVSGSGSGSSPARKEGRREIVTKLPSGKSKSAWSGGGQGHGQTFVEPELTEERRKLLASQPIYEEIPSFSAWDQRPSTPLGSQDPDSKSLLSQLTATTDVPLSFLPPPDPPSSSHNATGVQSATLPHPRRKPSADSSMMPRSVKRRGSGSLSHQSSSEAAVSLVTSPQAMTSSMTSALASSPSPFMTASMTASVLWGATPAQPTDVNGELLPLPPIPQMAPRSVSKETVSSGDSDTLSGGGGSGGTLSRPRPVPRRRPKRPDTAGSDQYVSMNRPNSQVTLGEAQLRETFARLTSLHFQTLHDVYVQCERLLTLDRAALGPAAAALKWADFDIYGQALHASGRCVVYNAKLRTTNLACQIMVLHSRPAAEMSQSTHPSLLRPAAIFADNVPFSFLTPEFIKTSQLLQNSLYDSSQARCFLAVGLFDVADSLSSHLTLLRETLTHDPSAYLQVLLMTTLQLLSAMSHCLDRGFTVTETDLGDVFHVTRADLRGKVVAFLPHQRAPDVPQGEAMCGFLDKLLMEATDAFYTGSDGDPEPELSEERHLLSTVERLRILLEPRRLENLAQLRAVVEYTLWGTPLPHHHAHHHHSSPGGGGDTPAAVAASGSNVGGGGGGGESGEGVGVGEGEASSVEQDHCAWLERERAAMVARFAVAPPSSVVSAVVGGGGVVGGPASSAPGVDLVDFYRLKFLLKSSATSLAECWRRLN